MQLRLSDRAEASDAKVHEGLPDLGLGIHDERSPTDDRLSDRRTGEDQRSGRSYRRKRSALAGAGEQGRFRITDLGAAFKSEPPRKSDDQGRVALRHINDDAGFAHQDQIPDVYGSECARRPAVAGEGASDHPDAASTAWQRDNGHLCGSDRLVPWRCKFESRR